MKNEVGAGVAILVIPRFQRCRTVLVIALVGFALALNGCKKQTGGSGSSDPQVNDTLAQLTRELHHTMMGRKLNRDFDEFVALSHVEVPPPPAGKKYAINEKWKVVLIDQKL